jgi:hypothetical protein
MATTNFGVSPPDMLLLNLAGRPRPRPDPVRQKGGDLEIDTSMIHPGQQQHGSPKHFQ